MGDYFLGEIRLFPYNKVPDGWQSCEGQVLQISQNQALYSLIGKAYGGDGVKTFMLPDLRGRVPVGMGNITSPNLIGPQGAVLQIAVAGGTEAVALTQTQVPTHTHALCAQPSNAPSLGIANSYPSTSVKPSGASPTAPGAPNLYAAPTATPGTIVALHAASVASDGGSAAHENRQPYLALRYCISISGLYPPRN